MMGVHYIFIILRFTWGQKERRVDAIKEVLIVRSFPDGSLVKNLPANPGYLGSVPKSG